LRERSRSDAGLGVEAVDVEDCDRDRSAVAVRTAHLGLGGVVERPRVREPRERVGAGVDERPPQGGHGERGEQEQAQASRDVPVRDRRM
jgi:hypothetical protein